MSGMSAWVTSDTTRWRRAVAGSVRKAMVVTPNPPQAQGSVAGRASPGPLRDRAPLCRAFGAPAPDKTVRPTVSSEKLESLTIDAIAHRDETDHRIVQQLGGRALLDRNSLGTGPPKAARWRAGACLRKSSARPNPQQTLHQTKAFCIDGRSGGTSKLIPKDTYAKPKSSV